jgi:hypothetical protein
VRQCGDEVMRQGEARCRGKEQRGKETEFGWGRIGRGTGWDDGPSSVRVKRGGGHCCVGVKVWDGRDPSGVRVNIPDSSAGRLYCQ